MPAQQRFSLRLTQAQRRAVADLAPHLAGRLKLAERNQRAIEFTRAELREIALKAGAALRQAGTATLRNSLLHVIRLTAQALHRCQGIGAVPAAERLSQFKITLRESAPPIWRRIQVRDGTLDKLHEHVQTAMGWTNSHLHHFRIGDQLYGDPMLMQENFEELARRASEGREEPSLARRANAARSRTAI